MFISIKFKGFIFVIARDLCLYDIICEGSCVIYYLFDEVFFGFVRLKWKKSWNENRKIFSF